MSDKYCYVPLTITVWKGDVCLFECDCEAKCEWSLPDGPSGPIDWDVTAYWFDNAGTVPGQRKTQRLARTAVAPQHVVAASGEERRGQVVRLAGHEARQVVAAMGAGQPLLSVAPAQEPSRHDPDAHAGGERAQHQVVVLRPAAIGVAERRHLPSHHQRRMCRCCRYHS